MARQHGLTIGKVGTWHEPFLRVAKNGLHHRPKNKEAVKDKLIKKFNQKIGGFVVEHDVLREALKPSPLAREMSDE